MGSVKAYFSGIESSVHFQHCVSANVKHVLTSFWQFHDKDRSFVRKRKKAHPSINFMIDSGAHTFITEFQKFMNWTKTQFEDYVEDYVRWIVDNRKYISAVVEFDIDRTLNMVLSGNENSSLGTSIVSSWQDSLFKPLKKKGIDVVYVWHEPRGMDGWEDMCAQFDYVGLPGVFSSASDFNKYVAIARRYTTRMHGFAATKQLDFRDVPWYSIDSITWKTGEMYGTLIDWDERTQKLTFVSDKSQRPLYRQKLAGLGFDADAIVNDTNYKEVTRYGLFSMRQMEAFYEKRYADRIQYHQLRLPHRLVLDKLGNSVIRDWWELFRPDVLFKQHCGDGLDRIRQHLKALSSVQNADTDHLKQNKEALNFLKCYFPKLVDPFPSDIRILQRELSVFISPPNPPPLPRSEPEHWDFSSSAPKQRKPEEFSIEDLVFESPEHHYLARFL